MGGQLGEKLVGDALIMGRWSSEQPKPIGSKDSDSQKRKRVTEEGENSLQKMHGIKKDYCHMNNLFSEDENEEQFFTTQAEALIGGSNPKSLREVKESPQWPEWESVIQRELDQLYKRGTWQLVEPPKDAIPLWNK